MSLKAIKNDTKGRGFCGPTAIAAVTGKKLSRVLDAIRDVRFPGWRNSWTKSVMGVPRIGGVGNYTMRHALLKLGYEMRPVWFAKPMTIERWCETHRGDKADYIFDVAWNPGGHFDGHWVAVGAGKCLDTFTKGVPVKAKDFLHRANPVREIWKVTKRAKSAFAA